MNDKTRTECVETLFNPSELITLDDVRGSLGRSPFIRQLVHLAARTHGMAPPPARESRGCRGPGKPASRASAAQFQRRHF